MDKYSPKVQAEGKIGNRRSIVRPSLLLPVYQRQNSLIHLSLIAMGDTRDAIEGNMGMGFRYLAENGNLFGAFGFYDIRKTSRNNTIHQATFGLEWFREYFEFRANVYLPKKRSFAISEVSSVLSDYRKSGSTINVELASKKTVEQALPGFDVEFGTQIPQLPDLTTRLAYYRFANSDKHVSTRNGVRGTINYELHENVKLETELSYDNQRKWVFFGGMTVSYNFGNKANYMALSRLEKKMTSLPIRDVDAVTAEDEVVIDSHKFDIDLDPSLTEGNGELAINFLIDSENEYKLIMLHEKNNKLLAVESDLQTRSKYIKKAVSDLKDSKMITVYVRSREDTGSSIRVIDSLSPQKGATIKVGSKSVSKGNYAQSIEAKSGMQLLTGVSELHDRLDHTIAKLKEDLLTEKRKLDELQSLLSNTQNQETNYILSRAEIEQIRTRIRELQRLNRRGIRRSVDYAQDSDLLRRILSGQDIPLGVDPTQTRIVSLEQEIRNLEDRAQHLEDQNAQRLRIIDSLRAREDHLLSRNDSTHNYLGTRIEHLQNSISGLRSQAIERELTIRQLQNDLLSRNQRIAQFEFSHRLQHDGVDLTLRTLQQDLLRVTTERDNLRQQLQQSSQSQSRFSRLRSRLGLHTQ